MKIRHSPHEQGNGLIIALMLSAIIGIDLVSYLTLVRSQNASTMRSLTSFSTSRTCCGVSGALEKSNVSFSGPT